ncbi:MAG TPA: POTRA domain-containing protein, partial [Vampirovibrionales bacterium]
LSVLVNEIILLDNEILPQYEIDKITKKYKNREVTFDELQDLTSELTALYRERGYVTSRIYLPPQKINNGLLTLQSSEGIISPVTLEEGKYFKARSIFPRLQTDEGQKLNLDKIKKDLSRLNENLDMGLQVKLKPGDEPGSSEVNFKADDRFPVHFAPYVDNLGRDLIGNERYGFALTHNNLLGFGDRNITNLHFTEGSLGVSNSYEIPVGKYGTKLGFNYAHSRLKLGKQFENAGIVGFATVYTPYVSQELFRGKHLQASADVAFDFKNLGNNFGSQGGYNIYGGKNGLKLTRDRLRVLRMGLNLDQYDKYGRTFMRHEIAQGLDILDASSKYRALNSRQGSGDSFFRYTAYGTRITQLPFG